MAKYQVVDKKAEDCIAETAAIKIIKISMHTIHNGPVEQNGSDATITMSY
jgi:hypothetical protein